MRTFEAEFNNITIASIEAGIELAKWKARLQFITILGSKVVTIVVIKYREYLKKLKALEAAKDQEEVEVVEVWRNEDEEAK